MVWDAFGRGYDIGNRIRQRGDERAYGEAYGRGGYGAVEEEAARRGDMEGIASAQDRANTQDVRMDERKVRALRWFQANGVAATNVLRAAQRYDPERRRAFLTQQQQRFIDMGFTPEQVQEGIERLSNPDQNQANQAFEEYIAAFNQHTQPDWDIEKMINPETGNEEARAVSVGPTGQIEQGPNAVTTGPGATFEGGAGFTHAYRINPATGQVETGGELPIKPQTALMYGGQPAPPSGYRYTEDQSGLEAIPGGPAATRNRFAASAARTALDSRRAKVQLVQRNIAEAIALSRGFGVTGAIGSVARNQPGNAAYDLRRKLDTIRANAGFDELLTLKAGGGTLGALSDSEREALESLIASLDQGQSDEQVRAALEDLQRYFAGAIARMETAYQRDYGDDGEGAPAVGSAPPQAGGLESLSDEELDRLEQELLNGGR